MKKPKKKPCKHSRAVCYLYDYGPLWCLTCNRWVSKPKQAGKAK